MLLERRHDVHPVVLHALDVLALHLAAVVVEAPQDKILAQAVRQNGWHGTTRGITELERLLDLVLGEQLQNFIAKLAGIGF